MPERGKTNSTLAHTLGAGHYLTLLTLNAFLAIYSLRSFKWWPDVGKLLIDHILEHVERNRFRVVPNDILKDDPEIEWFLSKNEGILPENEPLMATTDSYSFLVSMYDRRMRDYEGWVPKSHADLSLTMMSLSECLLLQLYGYEKPPKDAQPLIFGYLMETSIELMDKVR
jgi:hypothetical protein